MSEKAAATKYPGMGATPFEFGVAFRVWAPHAEKGGIYFYNDRRSHTPWGDTRPDYGRINKNPSE